MALLFSAVTVTAGEDEIELLVGGIPREYDDLEGWSEFDDLMYFISEETEVSVHAEAYLYGEGESMRASPEVCFIEVYLWRSVGNVVSVVYIRKLTKYPIIIRVMVFILFGLFSVSV